MRGHVSRREFLAALGAAAVQCGLAKLSPAAQGGDLIFMKGDLHKEEPQAPRGGLVDLYPVVQTDGYGEAQRCRRLFHHIIGNIYEFTFRPVYAFPSRKSANHLNYLLETPIGLVMSADRYVERFTIGRDYRGYGRWSNCDSSFGLSPSDREAMARIRVAGRLEAVAVDPILVDYLDNHCPREGGKVHMPEDALRRLGYFENLDAFKKNVRKYAIDGWDVLPEDRERYWYALVWGVRIVPNHPSRDRSIEG